MPLDATPALSPAAPRPAPTPAALQRFVDLLLADPDDDLALLTASDAELRQAAELFETWADRHANTFCGGIATRIDDVFDAEQRCRRQARRCRAAISARLDRGARAFYERTGVGR